MSVFVCGGSRGIGRAIAVGLAEPGGQVIINYLGSRTEADDAAEAVRARGSEAALIDGDVSTPEGAAEVMGRAAEITDYIGPLVHCAVKTVAGQILTADPVAFRSAVEVNAMSLLYILQAGLPLVGDGTSVIYLSSRGSRLALGGYASVGAPKAFAEAIIRYLAVELAPLGARANAISPTAQNTEAFRAVFPDDYEERLAAAVRNSPSARGVELEDIVDVARFLASSAATMIQGQVMVLDGGAGLTA